jgi:uncharacterized membrane protein YdjX (TVP38/TMEM64 family)
VTPSNLGTFVRGTVLLVVLLLVWWAASQVGAPDVEETRARMEQAGLWGPVSFLLLFAALTLLAVPKSVLTVVSGAVFGMAVGSLLAWTAGLVGAVAAFAVGRMLGRDAVERLIRGRLERIDQHLRDNGMWSVFTVRLIPVAPFTAISYGSGLSGVPFPPYAVGTALGMVPGVVAYASIGAYGTDDPWRAVFVAGGVVLLVAAAGALLRRRARGARAQAVEPGVEPGVEPDEGARA